MDYARFPGRPLRYLPPDPRRFGRRWTDWRTHPSAPMLESLLTERGLDECDVLIGRSGPSLAVETEDDVRYLDAADDPLEQAAELEAIARELDYAVAWLLRDRMIAAAATGVGVAQSGLPPPDRRGRRVASAAWAEPAWAVTASTPLLAHFASSGIPPSGALRVAAAMAARDGSGGVWRETAGLAILLEDGRLHCRSHGAGAYVMDRDDFDLVLPGQSMPASVALAAQGRRLSEVVSLSRLPALIADLNPIISEAAEHDDAWSGEIPGLRLRLEVGTETLADIPVPALASVGVPKRVPREVKPWLRPDLRADGTRRN